MNIWLEKYSLYREKKMSFHSKHNVYILLFGFVSNIYTYVEDVVCTVYLSVWIFLTSLRLLKIKIQLKHYIIFNGIEQTHRWNIKQKKNRKSLLRINRGHDWVISKLRCFSCNPLRRAWHSQSLRVLEALVLFLNISCDWKSAVFRDTAVRPT